MIQVQSADGVIHQFPEGTNPAVIDGAMKAYASRPEMRARADATQRVKNTPDQLRAFNKGATLGFADELDAGGAAVETGAHNLFNRLVGKPSVGYGMGDAYKAVMDANQEGDNAFAKAHPVQNVGLQIVGGLATPGLARGAKYVGEAASAGQAAVRSAQVGAAVGAVAGAGGGRGVSGRLTGAAEGGATGALIGAAAPTAARVAQNVAQRLGGKASQAAAPMLDQLTSAKDAAYKAVDTAGVTYKPEAFRSLTEDMAHAADAEGFNAGLHPKTAAMLQRIGESDRGAGGFAPTLTQLDQLRQQIGRDLGSSADAGERRMGAILRGKIDQFIASAGPEHINAGDPKAAASLIQRARDLNTRVEKLRSLDQLDEAAADRASATGSGGNVNNATRQNVIRFKKATGNLTPDEQAATQKVIDGTTAGNLFRQVGKLSPEGNGLMTGLHLVGALPSHGGTVFAAGVGAISKRVADAITAKNVQALRELIARGGAEGAQADEALQTAAKTNPAAAALYRQVASRISSATSATVGTNVFANAAAQR